MEKDVFRVIDQTALIENLLNQVIVTYISPREGIENFFWDIILDTSVMELGKKVTIVLAISQKYNIKFENDSLHKILNLRNAFAHHSSDSHPTLLVGKTPEEDKSFYRLKTVNSSGKINWWSREEALDQFNKSYDSAKDSLLALLSLIKDNIQY